jgi:hypothetical protein
MTYLDTPVNATVSEYRPVDLSDEYTTYSRDQIKQMVYDLGALAKENERFRLDVGSLRKQLNEGQACIESAKEILIEAIEINCIGKDVLINVAEALEIELIKEYNVTINVTFSGTVSVPLGFDMDYIEDHIDFQADANSHNNEVECDLFTEDIDITVNN